MCVIDYRVYMTRIQQKMNESHAPDGIIEEPWFDIVMSELNKISKDCSSEIQSETGQKYHKPSGDQEYHQAPPTRLLGLILPILAWLGWVMHEKYFDEFTWQKVIEAFAYGKQLSIDHNFK